MMMCISDKHLDKRRSFLQINIIILGVLSQTCPKYPKLEVCISLQYRQKNMGDEADFLSTDKQSFLQVASVSLGARS